MKRDAIVQLKGLKKHAATGWVDDVAQKNARENLMKAIGHNEERVVVDAQGAYLGWSIMQTAVRPIGVALLLLAFLSGGWFTTAKAAANSLPGDTLYGVKLATEQMHLFITSDDQRAVLHTQFAQRRLSEVQALQGSGDERSEQYLVETVHALEAEMIKAGDALSQMKLSGDENTLTVASILDEKIGAINAELESVNGQTEVVGAAQEAADQVAEDAVDTIVDSHEVEETQQSIEALERSFKNEYTSLRSRQEFDLGRVATIRSVVTENNLSVVTEDELLHMEFVINEATEDVADAMNLAAAGGYRAAFEILRESDAALLDIEVQLVRIESDIMEAMNAPTEESQDEVTEEIEQVQENETEVIPEIVEEVSMSEQTQE